ncbi:Uncharacterised protein [Mycobacteroides abscessus subsp. abscessus]|nr:Uncharacterised protein [Mycobacteroides abscessus subsp. abscessus]
MIGAAGLLVAAQGAVGSAEPGGAVAVPGAGPCLTDPKPVHEDLIPETLEVPVPYPVVTVLPPEPPEPEPVRTEMTLPSDPCVNPRTGSAFPRSS